LETLIYLFGLSKIDKFVVLAFHICKDHGFWIRETPDMDFFSKLDVLFPGRFGGLSSAWVFDILGAKLRHEID